MAAVTHVHPKFMDPQMLLIVWAQIADVTRAWDGIHCDRWSDWCRSTVQSKKVTKILLFLSKAQWKCFLLRQSWGEPGVLLLNFTGAAAAVASIFVWWNTITAQEFRAQIFFDCRQTITTVLPFFFPFLSVAKKHSGSLVYSNANIQLSLAMHRHMVTGQAD